MTLRITNSLTRRKEEFVPLDPAGRKVSFYNCGPTVYGPFHIGNARNFVVVDTMRRWLEAIGYEVHFVQNITDVDDKIIARSIEEGIPASEVAEKYTALFFEHLALLGVRKADEHPRATRFIEPMIKLVETLIAKGHAYASEDGSAWFDVRSFDGYGKLSKKNLDDMRQGERVNDEQQRLKRNPLDFCLWKASKPGEPSWDSPWGKGRPGWHLECSCMAMKCHHSDTIDIHSGGVDLQFPHHENEIAQSEAATGHPFARYWVHNGFLNIDGEKMSKSLGNFKNIDALLEKYDALTLRHFLLSASYRKELDFTQENLDACRKATSRYTEAGKRAAALAAELGVQLTPALWREDYAETDIAAALNGTLDEAKKTGALLYLAEFSTMMNDDFNTAGAIAWIQTLVTEINTDIANLARTQPDVLESAKLGIVKQGSLLLALRTILGLVPELEPKEENLGGLEEQLMQLLIDMRAMARKAKQFEMADAIRDRLGALDIVLEDSAQGTTWKRKG